MELIKDGPYRFRLPQQAIGTGKVVIGVSGGLDSAHALTVAVESMDRLGLPRRNILAYTMPGFAASEATRDHARQLMTALGATPGEIDIRPSGRQMLPSGKAAPRSG